MFNKHDLKRNACQLYGGHASTGYDWWWHSFTAQNEKTGKDKPFYIEFFVCNPASGKDEPVFGQLPENKEKGIKPSYLMINVGSWGDGKAQLHRFFGWGNCEVDMGTPFFVKASDCEMSETYTKGSIHITKEENDAHPEWMSDEGDVSWDIKIDKKVAFNVGYGAGNLFRRLQLFEMFWHAEGMKTAYSGEITWNGEKYIVSPEKSFGYADKNWGKNFTTPWVWLSSNNLTSEITGKKLENSVFDIGGGKPKVGFISLDRKLLSAFWYEGQCYEFNFSKFWTNTRTEFYGYETEDLIVWHVAQKTWQNEMVTDITCQKKDMLLINYEAPTGEKRHNRLWNGGNGEGSIKLYHKGKLVDSIHCENIGCEYGEFDHPGEYSEFRNKV